MSGQFDDPNREAVGLEPIWTGADTAPDEHEVQQIPMEDDGTDDTEHKSKSKAK